MSDKPKIYNLPGMLSGVQAMKDKGLKVTIHTQEVDPVKAGAIMMSHGKHIYFFMSEQEFQTDDIMGGLEEMKPAYEKYTMSQKLRFTLMDLHEAKGGTKVEFEESYRLMMDDIIKFYRTKANEIRDAKK